MGMLIFLFTLNVSAAQSSTQGSAQTTTVVTPSTDTAPTTDKKVVESSLDERIKSLQMSKDCIHDATTKAEIDQCRKRIIIKVKAQ